MITVSKKCSCCGQTITTHKVKLNEMGVWFDCENCKSTMFSKWENLNKILVNLLS